MSAEIDIIAKPRRKPVTLTIREDIMREAKTLALNASKAAEAGIFEAVRKARAEAWLAENAEAIEAHNRRVAERGIAIPPIWTTRT